MVRVKLRLLTLAVDASAELSEMIALGPSGG
jgi:hypothetical protein